MPRITMFAIAGMLSIVTITWADAPLPPHLKFVDPRVRFVGVENYPDQVFVLRYLTPGGPAGVPQRVVQVKDSNAFNLKARTRLEDMKLFAIQRKEFEKFSDADAALQWFNDKTDGVLWTRIEEPSTTAPAKAQETPITTYRVSLQDGKLTVERVAGPKTSGALPLGLLPTSALAVIASVSIAWLGVWFARRKSATNEPGNQRA